MTFEKRANKYKEKIRGRRAARIPLPAIPEGLREDGSREETFMTTEMLLEVEELATAMKQRLPNKINRTEEWWRARPLKSR